MSTLYNNNLVRLPSEYLQELCKFLDPSSVIAFSRVSRDVHDLILQHWDSLLPIFITNHFRYPLHPYLLPSEQFQRLQIAESRAGIVQQRILDGHEGGCRTLLMSKNNPRVLSTGREEMKIWDPITGKCLHRLNTNHDFFLITDDGKRALSLSPERRVNRLTLWDLDRGVVHCDIPLWNAEESSNKIQHVGMSDDGKKVLCLYRHTPPDGEAEWILKLFDNTGNLQSHLTIDMPCTVGHLNMDGTRVILRLADQSLQLWDLTTGNCRHTLKKFKCLYVSSDTKRAFIRLQDTFADQEMDGESAWLDIDSGTMTLANSLEIGANVHFYCFAINHDATRALTVSSPKRRLQEWDFTTGKCLHTLVDHPHLPSVPTKSAWYTPNEKRAVSLDKSGILRLWDLDTGECLSTVLGKLHVARGLRMDAYGMTAVSSTHDGKITVWNLTPLFEESLCSLSRSFRWQCSEAVAEFKRLPMFIQKAVSNKLSSKLLQEMRPLMGFHGLPCAFPTPSIYGRELSHGLDMFIGRNFLIEMAEIIRKYGLVASPSVEARVANLPESIQQRLYKEIEWQQAINDTLPPNRPPNYGELAFYNREGYSSSPEEKRAALLAIWDKMEREQ